MNKKVLYLLIGLICIALTGIIAVQFFWIRNAIEVREAQFASSVNDAMGMAVNKIETRENVCFIGKNCKRDSICGMFQAISQDTIINLEPKLDSMIGMDEPGKASHKPFNQHIISYQLSIGQGNNKNTRIYYDSLIKEYNQDFIEGLTPNPEQLFTWNNEELNRLDSLFQQQEIVYDGAFNYQIETNGFDDQQMIIHYSVNPTNLNTTHQTLPKKKVMKDRLNKFNKKIVKVQDVIKKMTIEMESKPRTIEQRINKEEVEKTLQKAFADKDIIQPFEFAVISPSEKNKFTPVRSDGFKPEFISSKYQVSLFPNDIFQKQSLLIVHFPGQASNILRSLSWLMITSILFTIIIMITSGLSIVVMIRQKKISDIKTDFINNMTHEFKTPIATISIAVDSINNPKVIARPDIIKNYTKVIKEENSRMNTRVEQVLQMALLDSSEFKLNEKVIDVHELIQKVTDNMRIQTENRNGHLEVNYGAGQTKVMGDESHLTNVFISLIDNAIKYSPEHPAITVSTFNTGNSVVISVEDNGLGMSNETQKKIFDKFYRVTSGNIHSIKGFGLGLSYAKAIVLALRGEIKVKSEPGKGSRFEVILPNIADELTNC
jgi:two-component system, OmpR family, phosphate regulon sensor histidine kinase PhoR